MLTPAEISFDLSKTAFTGPQFYFWIQYDDVDSQGNAIHSVSNWNATSGSLVFNYKYRTKGAKKMNISISDSAFIATGTTFPAYYSVTSDGKPPAIAALSFEVIESTGTLATIFSIY